MGFDLPADYKQVPERIADLKAKHPEARLRPVENPSRFYDIVTIGNKTFIVYAAACYRDSEDEAPGIGIAWEPFPGPTAFTRDSELQNAETSAWGRAIVAALASESKSVSSAEDVRNRQAGSDPTPYEPVTYATKDECDAVVAQLNALPDEAKKLVKWRMAEAGFSFKAGLTPDELAQVAKWASDSTPPPPESEPEAGGGVPHAPSSAPDPSGAGAALGEEAPPAPDPLVERTKELEAAARAKKTERVRADTA